MRILNTPRAQKRLGRVLPALAFCLTALIVAPLAHAKTAAEPASSETRKFADWVIASGDNAGLSFVIVDKVQARVSVFDPDGRPRGDSAALLGLAHGDGSAPGIGQRKLSSIRPDERTTPAGRFIASIALNLNQKEVIWIDYANAISLHPVVSASAAERRLERLATASPDDNRISYGCINVPRNFYDRVVRPTFSGASGIVYVMPEVRSLLEVFPAFGG